MTYLVSDVAKSDQVFVGAVQGQLVVASTLSDIFVPSERKSYSGESHLLS